MAKEQSVYWLCTWNNPPGLTVESSGSDFEFPIDDRILCARYALEYGEKGGAGALHLQMAIVFKKRVRLSVLRKMFPGAHCEIKGEHSSMEQFYNYPGRPGKSGQVFWVAEYGDSSSLPLRKGFRSDLVKRVAVLEEIHQELLSGATLEMMWDKYFSTMIYAYRGIYEYFYAMRRAKEVEKAMAFDFKAENEERRLRSEEDDRSMAFMMHMSDLDEKDEVARQEAFDMWYRK